MSGEKIFGISAKLEIKTEIPSDASGRLAHSAADAVSPITEWLGLQGDKIRIHRRRVVEKLIEEAQNRLSDKSARPHPIPLKIAVSLIERASQEEIDDDFMIQAWAGLLASAATDALSPRFVSLLSELNGRQAALLMSIDAQRAPSSDIVVESVRSILCPNGKALDPKEVTEAQIEAIGSLFGPGIIIARIYDSKLHEETPLVKASEERMLDLDILESVGLVTPWRPLLNLSEKRTQISNWSVELRCQCMSYLGIELIRLTRSPSNF